MDIASSERRPRDKEGIQPITLSCGLLGYSHIKDYFLKEITAFSDFADLRLLESLTHPDIKFVVKPLPLGDPFIQEKDFYKAVKILNFNATESCIYAIVTLYKNKDKIEYSLNLKAPLIIDFSLHKGEQFVFLDQNYSMKQEWYP